MSREELIQQAMALPLTERIELAQALWRSIHPDIEGSIDGEDRSLIEEVLKRDEEMTLGIVAGHSHEAVMDEVRKLFDQA